MSGSKSIAHESPSPPQVVLPVVQTPEVMELAEDRQRKKVKDKRQTRCSSCLSRDISPLGHGPPGTVLIGQDVEDLLFQLVSSHMISVLGSTDQVVAHLLFLSAVGSVLGTVRLGGLGGGGRQ